ncbi:ShlB/FhaC/HecB family hemolysin secretion/activation protein [Fusobacterium sp. PH5-44]|uniref:ShlB/FhaC/HecB family hemolysin secretion/activation protein n=1 Tax=unclassified Fusobacterium TaxID=2648384 RepID=UPI003D1BD689
MKLKLSIFLILLSLFSFTTTSEEVIEIRAGGTPLGTYTTSPENDSKASYEIMVEYRKSISDNFQIGIGTGYQNHGKIKSYTDVQDANLKVVVGETKLYDSIPLYITARYEFNKNGDWIPFIKANLGYSFNINKDNTNYYKTINKNNGQVMDSGMLRKFSAKNGIYYGVGIGIGYKNITFDVSYNVNTAKIESINYLNQKSHGRGDFSNIIFSMGFQHRFNNNFVPYYVKDNNKDVYIKKEPKLKLDKNSTKNKKDNAKNKQELNSQNKKAKEKNIILKDELPKEQRDFFDIASNPTSSNKGGNSNIDKSLLPNFYINQINVVDELQLIDDSIKYTILKKYENKNLTLVDIRELGQELNEQYMNAGYVTTRVMMPQQDLTTNTLNLNVVYGKIEEIILDEDTARDRRKVFFAFPNGIGEILNIKDIDQGIDNINRLESNDVKMDIVAGDGFGFSKIVIKSNKEKPWRIKVGYDHLEEEKKKIRTTIELDNLIGINDSFYAYYKGDAENLGKSKNNKDDTYSLSAGYSFPIKTWELSLDYSLTKEKTINRGSSYSYELKSKTIDYSFNASKMLYRDDNLKVKLDLGLAIKSEETYIDGIKLKSQDRDFAVANIGISGIWRVFNGMSSYSIMYYRGLDGLGSKKDHEFSIGVMTEPNSSSSDKKYQFDKVYGSFSWYRPFNIGKQNFTFRTIFAGQYTRDNLFSNERISIGGHETIRGFSKNVSGDIGFYSRTEISYIFPKISKSEKINQFIYRIRPFISYDYGKVRDNYKTNGKKNGPITTGSGYGIGARYYGNKLNLDVGVVKGDKNMDIIKKEKFRGYISATITF